LLPSSTFLCRINGRSYTSKKTTAAAGSRPEKRRETARGVVQSSEAGGFPAGAEDRLLWGTGFSAVHPRPLIELFWDFEMPADLVEGYRYPELTKEMKKKILGGNFARKMGTTVEELKNGLPDDEIAKVKAAGLRPPWDKIPELVK